jgi:hypothetical protein
MERRSRCTEAELGSAGIRKNGLHASTEPKQEPVADDALWLWGRLNDFERVGILTKSPSDLSDGAVTGPLY